MIGATEPVARTRRAARSPRQRSSSRERTAGASTARTGFTAFRTPPTTSGWSGRRCSARARRCSSWAGTSWRSIDLVPGAAPSDAPTRLDELLAFVVAAPPAASLLHPDLGLWRALHARARSVVALAARMADAAARPLRVRRPSSRRRLPPSEDRRGRRSAGVLRRHRSDGPSLGHDRASRRGAGADDAARRTVRAVSRSPGHGHGTGRGQPRRAGARSLACARRGADAAGRRSDSDDLWPSDVTPDLDGRRRRDRPDDAGIRSAAGRPGVRGAVSGFDRRRRRQTIYIESQYFTNDKLGAALAARLREPDGPEVMVVAPKECHGWLEQNTMGAFRDGVFRQLLAADTHKRLRLVYPAASRAQSGADVRPLEGDDRRRRAGAHRLGQLLAALDGRGHGMRSGGRRRRRSRGAGGHSPHPRSAARQNISACQRRTSRAGSSAPGRSRALIDARERCRHTLVRIE